MVIVASRRAKRPKLNEAKKSKPACPFCPGSEHITPQSTLQLPSKGPWLVRSFPNKFAFLSPAKPHSGKAGYGPAFGYHEVIVETNRHGEQFQDFSAAQRKLVFEAYRNRFKALTEKNEIQCVYLFNNHGPKGGASIDHEHAQITGLPFAPPILASEYNESLKSKHCTYCQLAGEKTYKLAQNKDFVAVCPPYSRFAYEVWVVSKHHKESFLELSEGEGMNLMELLCKVVKKICKVSPDYNMAFHQSSKAGKLHFHVEIYPRKDTWAGFELGAGVYVNTAGEAHSLSVLKKL